MNASISVITLGVSNLKQAITFYETIGFQRTPFDSPTIAFFDAGGIQLALFPRDELAKDANTTSEGNGFSGITLAQMFSTSKAVDAHLLLAEQSGGTITKPAEPVFWGGYSGYFSDPDGHLWEVACSSADYQKTQ